MFSGSQVKNSRRSSFLIRDLLSTATPVQISSAPSKGLPQDHPLGAGQFNFLTRPSLARILSHQQAFVHLGLNCPSCPAWAQGSCLGFFHGKPFLPGHGNFSQSDLERNHGGLSTLGDSSFPVPIPLPVYMRTRSPTSSPGGSGKHRKNRRSRTVFTELQLMGLERRFDKQKYLSTPDRIELADTLGLSQIQVKTWYQNRRMKWKKQVLSAGGTEPPTKPKGRPKKNSIPSAQDIMATELKSEISSENKQKIREKQLSSLTDSIVLKS